MPPVEVVSHCWQVVSTFVICDYCFLGDRLGMRAAKGTIEMKDRRLHARSLYSRQQPLARRGTWLGTATMRGFSLLSKPRQLTILPSVMCT